MGRIWDKLRRRLKDELNLKCEKNFIRTRAGYNQRSVGAWSWYSPLSETTIYVGSQWSMTELIKTAKLVKYRPSGQIDIDIIPEDARGKLCAPLDGQEEN